MSWASGQCPAPEPGRSGLATSAFSFKRLTALRAATAARVLAWLPTEALSCPEPTSCCLPAQGALEEEWPVLAFTMLPVLTEFSPAGVSAHRADVLALCRGPQCRGPGHASLPGGHSPGHLGADNGLPSGWPIPTSYEQ